MPFTPDKPSSGFKPDTMQQSGGFAPVKEDDYEEWESALHGAGQGATFGFSDELYGGARSFVESGSLDLYKKYRDEYRQELESARKANPKSYMAGEVGGGIAAGALTGGAGAASTIPRMVATGAATGGLYGAGASNADSALGVAADAGIGGTLGGAFGGAIGGVTKVAGQAFHAMKPSRAVETIYNDIIKKTGMDHASINKILKEQPDMFLADMHPQLRGLLHEVGGPKALAVLEERTRGTASRVMAQIGRRTGIPELSQLSDDVSNAYRAAYSQKLPLTAIQRIRKTINPDNEFAKKAEKMAVKLWKGEPDNAFRELPPQWSVEWQDYMQRGFRQIGAKKGQPKAGLNKYSKELRNILQEEVPEFAGATDLSHKQILLNELWDHLQSKNNLTDITKDLRTKPKQFEGIAKMMGSKWDDFVDDLQKEAERYATFNSVKGGQGKGQEIVQEEVKAAIMNLGVVYAAGIGLGAQKGLATQAAYMRLLRSIVFRSGGTADALQKQLAERLLSGAAVKQVAPLASGSLGVAGAAGTIPEALINQTQNIQ